MASGRQGLHRDTFEDWEVPGQTVEVPQAYDELMAEMEYLRKGGANFQGAGDEGNRKDWTREAPELLRQVLILDPSEDTRQALAYSVVTWLTGALHRAAWKEAQRALELLGEIDPDHSRTSEEIAAAIVTLDAEALAEGLDEAEPEDQGRFAGLAVGLGKPAVNLVFDVMRHATRVRTRAAACTALSYLCAEEPELLGPYLSDSRWDVVLNMVFVLGQIGGPKVVDLLRVAAQHPEPKVRRQVVQALGSVPPTDRLPVLLNELDTLDSQLLSATLNMLTREKNRHVARAILDCIESPRFESRSEDSQRTLFNALADVADDEAIAALEALLNKGGWFSRRTFTRQAAARTLQRIGTLGAMAVLQTGLKSKSAAVRETCREALNAGGSV